MDETSPMRLIFVDHPSFTGLWKVTELLHHKLHV